MSDDLAQIWPVRLGKGDVVDVPGRGHLTCAGRGEVASSARPTFFRFKAEEGGTFDLDARETVGHVRGAGYGVLPEKILGGPGEIREGMRVNCREGALPKDYGRPSAVIVSVGPKTCKVRVAGDSTDRYIPHELLDLFFRQETADAYGVDPRDVALPYRGRHTNPRGSHRKWLPRWAWVGWTVAEHLEYARGEREAPLEPAPAPPPSRLLIVSCGGEKRTKPRDAFDMYTGSYHKALRRAADALMKGSDPYQMILSARYGLLDLHDVIKPYEQRMDKPGAVAVDTVRYQAEQLGLVGCEDVIVLAGAAYADVVSEVWPDAHRPLDGLGGMGYQLQALKEIERTGTLPDPREPQQFDLLAWADDLLAGKFDDAA